MSAKKNYETVLRKLRGDTGEDDLSADIKKTFDAMDARYSFSSTRVALTALKREYPASKEILAEFEKRAVQWKKIDTAQEPTDLQKSKYVPWEKLIEFREMYRDQMSLQEYFLLCLYTMWEPARADYTPMIIVNRKPRTLADGMNYMVVTGAAINVIFHSYKTHRKYGDITRKMPKELERVTRQYLSAQCQTYLFETDGVAWQPQRLSIAVKKLFQRFHAMNTGISSIRHSYATHIYKGIPSLVQLNKTSQRMMHSVVTAQAYRFLDLE